MVDQRRVSKLYRKVITSNEFKSFLILENCDEEIKQELKRKLESNGSSYAKELVKKIDNI